MAIFTRVLGWTKEETDVFLVDVRKDMKNTKYHAYWNMQDFLRSDILFATDFVTVMSFMHRNQKCRAARKNQGAFRSIFKISLISP